MTSMRLRVIVAMIGWRLELTLKVLNVNFLSSASGNDGERGVFAVMLDVRREWAGFNTQRAFSVRPCSSVLLNS